MEVNINELRKKFPKGHMVQVIKGDGAPIRSQSVGRNTVCPCGSGKKAKACCGTAVKYFSTKKPSTEPVKQ